MIVNMKVLMIGPDRNGQGGIATVVNQYYEAHLDKKVDLMYITTVIDGSKFKKLGVAFKALLKFNRQIRQCDVLHVHMSSRKSFYRKRIFIAIAKKYNKKIVIHMHGSEFDVFFDKECTKQQQESVCKTFALADAVIVLSEEWKNFFCKICNRDKIVVIYNAVMLPDFEKLNYQDNRVLFLGRLGKRKGIFDLIHAIPRVIEKIPDVQFYLCGDGEVDNCKKLCEELGIESHVFFLGWVGCKEKVEILKACSIFVLPSYHEGLPMALLEAMSYGEVVITTAVGGIPEVIRDGVNGYIIEAGNIQEIAQRLIDVLTTVRRENIGKAARNTVAENFDIEKNIHNLLSLYGKLLLNESR